MYPDQDKKKIEKGDDVFSVREEISLLDRMYVRYIIFIVVGFAVIAGTGIAFVKLDMFPRAKEKPKKTAVVIPASEQATSSFGRLPSDPGNINDDEYALGTSTAGLKAENITFGDFYEPYQGGLPASVASYDLPINIKTDTLNYYDLARKLDLDPSVEEINKNGFAVLDNQYIGEADNFFDIYRLLISREIPINITSDYIIYYYQDTLKQAFKEIEQNIFFDNLWDIDLELYNLAIARYRNLQREYGVVNDIGIEGARLESAYLGVALKLLMPNDKQINYEDNFLDITKFEEYEAEFYNIELPDLIKSQVDEEVELIRNAKESVKSPVFLYDIDYTRFIVPSVYRANAKLNNFYLATQWLNSVFPLYYRSDECPECLLDKEDWGVSMAAASFLTQDLYRNQDLKNDWAAIYKFLSFFQGLRGELNFLHFNKALTKLFGDDYSAENIFINDKADRTENMAALQAELTNVDFDEFDGGLNRGDPAVRANIGLRLLQEPFWPNNYLLNQLTGEDMALKTDGKNPIIITDCGRNNSRYRCAGIGYDIINIVSSPMSSNPYYTENINYTGYSEKLGIIKQNISKFGGYEWNDNIFWSTMYLVNPILEYNKSVRPAYMQNEAWSDKRDINTALGTWVNLHLSDDSWQPYEEDRSGGLGSYHECNQYNFVEPAAELIRELIAKNRMLVKTMMALRIGDKANTAIVMVKDMNSDLSDMYEIIEKELKGEELDANDCRLITNMVNQFSVGNNKADKTLTVEFPKKNTLTAKLEGNKLVVVASQTRDGMILTVGPIFNYIEN